jgi:AAA+ superfamily predicted ATPase
MSQYEYIKSIAKYGLENDRDNLMSVLNELIEHSKKTKKVNFAIQLQSILKESLKEKHSRNLAKTESSSHLQQLSDRETDELVLEKLTSDYRFENLVCEDKAKSQLEYFIKEHQSAELLRNFNLPIANKLLLHGPSGCGKTLTSYVIAGELQKMMIVINLGAIVSSKLGETSKNIAKVFRKAAVEDCIIFIDEFDSLGKVRDYNQDHGEMKRVVNTILQLFDYLPQESIVIAATNQKNMLDDALLRRFDASIELELPKEQKIRELIDVTLKQGTFKFDKPKSALSIAKKAKGLSYYSIQKTLITAIKRSLFAHVDNQTKPLSAKIDTGVWRTLIEEEFTSLQ